MADIKISFPKNIYLSDMIYYFFARILISHVRANFLQFSANANDRELRIKPCNAR